MLRISALFALCLGFHVNCVYGQVGCSSGGGVCTNPVPAVNLTRTWTDDTSATWTITSYSYGAVTGTVRVPNPVYVQGYTSFTWNASNPNPTSSCGIPAYSNMTYSGTIQNNGNDRGTGTWQRPGASGSFTTNKNPRDIPNSEITNAVGFSGGYLATVGQFRQTLTSSSGSGDIFKGRQVSEATGFGTNYDNCWFPGSSVPKWDKVQGSVWNVGYYMTLDNTWVDDYIGWNTAQVDYYRQRLTPSSFPCGAQIPQSMYIAISGTSGSRSNYKNHSVGGQIYLDRVTVNRDGVSQTAYR